MLEKPLISIIIPTYNRAHIIPETLDSILAQTYTNWECIVVDDGSTDNTKAVIENYIKRDNRFHYYKRPDEKQKGPCSCRNYGFEKSSGQFINFFDSDDLLKPQAFEVAYDTFNDDIDAVVMKSVLTNLETGDFISANNFMSENLLTDYFIGKVTYLVSGPVWKREFLNSQPYLFDENLRNVDDWDFNLRMLYETPNLKILEEEFILYRMHTSSLSKEIRKLNKLEIISDFQARDKHLKLIKGRSDIDFYIVHNYLIWRYKRYFKWAMKRNVKLTTFIGCKLVKEQLKFKRYGSALKSVIGFLMFRLTGRGYMFFKDV